MEKYLKMLDYFIKHNDLDLFFRSAGIHGPSQTLNDDTFFPKEALIIIDEYCKFSNIKYLQSNLISLIKEWLTYDEGLLKAYITIITFKRLKLKNIITEDLFPYWSRAKLSVPWIFICLTTYAGISASGWMKDAKWSKYPSTCPAVTLAMPICSMIY